MTRIRVAMDMRDLLPDSARKTADIVADMAVKNPRIFREIYQMAMQDNGIYSMRASRVLYLSALINPGMVEEFLPDMVDRLPAIANESLRRNVLNTLKLNIHRLREEETGRLVNHCFNFVARSHEPVGVQVYALEILYNLSLIYPEIAGELAATIGERMPRSKAAFQAVGRKIMKKLREQDSFMSTG